MNRIDEIEGGRSQKLKQIFESNNDRSGLQTKTYEELIHEKLLGGRQVETEKQRTRTQNQLSSEPN